MSRSKWAWTEGYAPVDVVACGVGERAGRGPLGAVSSTKRLVKLMAASMFVIALAPAPALAGSASGSHVKTPTPNKQYSTHVDRASAVVLALGSGYSSRGGAARVRVLQRRLAGAGFASGPIDGRYGPRTEQAVRSFQAAHGLGVDGIAGPLTLAALSRPSVALYPGAGYAGRGLARVRVLQRRLAGAGFPSGPIDGRYGPRTEQAVRSFQAAHGLGVDGIAGAQMLAYLGNRQPTPHQATQPSRPAGSHRPAIRSSRPAAPRRKVVPTIRSTGSPSIGLLVLLIAPVALGLSATWLARRRHNRRYTDADAGINRAPRSDPADATVVRPNPTPNQTTTPAAAITPPSADPEGPDDADDAYRHGLLLEEYGDEMGAMAAYQRADQLGHGGAACDLGVLLGQRGDLAAAEACFQRADQRGIPAGAFNLGVLLEEQGNHLEALRAYERAEQRWDPTTADMARAAALDLRRQSESAIAVGQGGGHDGP